MKVYLTGRDFINWATDDDYFLYKELLSKSFTIIDSPIEADIIHAINWTSLSSIKRELLETKPVVAHLSHDPEMMFENESYPILNKCVDVWITPSMHAQNRLKQYNITSTYSPYPINQFFCIEKGLSIDEKNKLKEKWQIPRNKFLIGSFQRDTQGYDLNKPKTVKGPDIFVELVRKLDDIHIVLAGPRRKWIRKQLDKYKIPYTFIGSEIETDKDDLAKNNLDKEIIKELYQTLDLYVVASRLEGGPKAITECVSLGVPIISSKVGHVEDCLPLSLIFETIEAGKDLINRIKDKKHEIEYKSLPEFDVKLIEDVYQNALEKSKKKKFTTEKTSWIQKFIKKEKSVSCYYETKVTPWGGANQFLKYLFKVLENKGFIFEKSSYSTQFINSFHNIDKYSVKALSRNKVVHRIDGPTYLIRGTDKELDDKLFELNSNYADVSVFQSHWSLKKTYELGYNPNNPIVITNCSDPAIFKNKWINGFLPISDRKIKLIGTSWSANERKGLNDYKWLDEHLDFSKIEFTFVGNINASFKNIIVKPPMNSVDLAIELAQHDIYFAPSENDPCSNALIEAMTVGLPVIFKNSGGHPELVSQGGLSFITSNEIPDLIEVIKNDYERFVNLVTPPDQYLTILRYKHVLFDKII